MAAVEDVQHRPLGSGAAPQDWTIPGGLYFKLKAAHAVYDGTSASGAFLPCLEILSDAGQSTGKYVASQVAAGASAEVSWFPGVNQVPRTNTIFPGTSVNRNLTGQTILTADATSVIFDTVLFDDLGWYDHVNKDRIKVSEPGRYLVVFALSWVYPAASGFVVQGGIDHYPGPTPVIGVEFTSIAGTPNLTSGSAVVTASAGDWFVLEAYQNSGGSQKTWFTGAEGPDEQPYPTLTVIRIGN